MGKTPLQRAAAAQDEAATKKKARGILASLGALLGLGSDEAAQPAAKMSKHTVTTKRVEMTEGDDEDSTDGGSMSTDGGTDSTGSEAEEEEAAAEEEEGSAAEEEEEEAAAAPTGPAAAMGRTAAKPHGKTMKAALAAADAAFLAALPEAQRASAALRMPSRVVRYAKKATGAKSLDEALGALSAMPERDAANAKIEADVASLKANDRKRRIEAIVDQARAEGRSGATNKAGRASLREIGMAQGSKFLKGHVATLPIVAQPHAKVPGKIAAAGEGAPATLDQKAMMGRAQAGLSAEEQKAFAEIAAEKIKDMNGAAARTTED